jgi:AraC family transcriptional regulator
MDDEAMKLSGHGGEIISSQPLASFVLTEIDYGSRLHVPKHSHQHACFSFVLQGSYREVYREKIVESRRSDLVFRPAGEVHSDYFGEMNVRCLLIEFDPQWLETFGGTSIILNEPTVYQGHTLRWLATRLHRESKHRDDFAALTVEGLMLEIVGEIGRRSTRSSEDNQPGWLRQAREILNENFTERMSLSELARLVGVHPVYLAGTFRQHYKCTIGEYVRRLRIEFASREISKTNARLANIALAAGFSHQGHFTRTFKRLTGLTPGEFRAISRRIS